MQFHQSSKWSRLKNIRICGIDIVTASRQELVRAWVSDCAAAQGTSPPLRPRLVFDANGHSVSLRETSTEYRTALDQADLVHADGGFLVSLSRIRHAKGIAERSGTTDMFHDFARRAQKAGLGFYLLGGTEEINSRCAAEMNRLYPRLRIVGRKNGYFGADLEDAVVDEINLARPDVLWVGLGKPLEQQFCVRNASRLNAVWAVTCGGCFNFVTGHYKRAPRWMRRYNLEWLHRMFSHPRKLFWRYLTTTPHALWLALKDSRQQSDD